MGHLGFHLACRFAGAHMPGISDRLRPLKLTVAATYRCNHRCRLCNVWKVSQAGGGEASPELTPDEYEKVFSELKQSLLYLDWGGGEPFLREDTATIIRSAARRCPRLSEIVFSTNGYWTDRIVATVEEMARDLPKHRLAIGVSLDGVEELHDHLRGVKGAFRATMETLTQLRTLTKRFSTLSVKMSYTLSSLNAGQFSTFQKEVLRPLGWAVDDVGFNLEHTGNLFHNVGEEGRNLPDGRQAMIQDIQQVVNSTRGSGSTNLQRAKLGMRLFFLQQIPRYWENPGKQVIPCQATRNSLFLDPTGAVYPCIIWGKRLGHCRDGMATLLSSPETRDTRKQIAEEKCPGCWNACEMIPSLLTSTRLFSVLRAALTSDRHYGICCTR